MGDSATPIRLRSLLPAAEPLNAGEALDGLDFGALAPASRPYVVTNMIATLDGKATIAGRSGALGNAADHELFHRLRAQGDAVLVGANTVRVERYGRLLKDPALRELRVRRGQPSEPICCIVSASLDLDPELGLLAEPEADVVILTSARGELPACAARVSYLRHEGEGPLRLGPLLQRLQAERGVRSIVCEGGPTLNASLLAVGLIDELFLSISPKLVGGGNALTIVAGEPLPVPVEVQLRWLLEYEGQLFGRYLVTPA